MPGFPLPPGGQKRFRQDRDGGGDADERNAWRTGVAAGGALVLVHLAVAVLAVRVATVAGEPSSTRDEPLPPDPSERA